MSEWIEVDRKGLAQVLADRPKSFLLFELVQNALDEDTSRVVVEITPESGRSYRVSVTDNSPDGYQDIRHAWTLFAPSKKKGDPELRGRFNVGCKHVLALASWAKVVSTRAAVEFGPQGRRSLRERREAGTRFEGLFRLSKRDVEEMVSSLHRLIIPEGVELILRSPLGEDRILPRTPVHGFETTLPTVISDEEGNLRGTRRKTRVDLYEVAEGEEPTLYELGIPVVTLDGGDPYHIDVRQRVPLNTDRDNVTPAYLRTLRVHVLEAIESLDEDVVSEVWVTEASEDPRASAEAVGKVLDARYGEKRVAFDPSDPEANKIAVSRGYVVVPGRALTRGQWENAKRHGLLAPAGRVTPSPRVETSSDGIPPLPESEWDEEMKELATFAKDLASRLGVCENLTVRWYRHRDLSFSGAWDGSLSLNRSRLGRVLKAWRAGDKKPFVALLIHEFAHDKSGDHLSSDYHEELCRLASLLWSWSQ